MRKLLGSFTLVLLAVNLSAPALAVDAFYLGGQIGHVTSPANAFSNAIGFGVDLGVRTNPLLDLVFQIQHSSHNGGAGLSLNSATVAADFHFWEFNDFEFSLGGGPGFYFMSSGTSETYFGLHIGSNVDVVVDDHLRVGLGLRYHGVFAGSGNSNGSYWTAMMRVGYLFSGN